MLRKLTLWLLGVVIIAALAAILAWVGFIWVKENLALKGAEWLEYSGLEYAGRVTFSSTKGMDNYQTVKWYAGDWNDPGPCPIVVHLPDADLDAEALGDFEKLKAQGWRQRNSVEETIELVSSERIVRCWFKEKRLYQVIVSVVPVPGREVPPVFMSLGGGTVPLPASEATIVESLGPPTHKWSLG